MIGNLYDIVLSFLGGVAATAVAMPILLKICKLWGIYDMPGGRKVHDKAIPRLGGVLFMPSMMIGVLVALFFHLGGFYGEITFRVSTLVMAMGAFLVYIVGFVDDLIELKANHKFLFQLVAAMALPVCWLHINNFYGLFGLHELPIWFSYPFSVFVILLIVNSINLIDGIDGLSSGLCILMLTIYAVLFYFINSTFIYCIGAMALVGSLLVFWCFNVFGKAERGTKTFMGDSGSLFLGYAVAYLSIKYAMNNNNVLPYRPYALLVSYTLLIVPTFDVIRVSVYRFLHHMPVFGADKNHIHHRVMAAGFTMHQALFIILGLFLLFCVLNAALYYVGVCFTWIVFIDVAVFLGFIQFMKHKASKLSLEQKMM